MLDNKNWIRAAVDLEGNCPIFLKDLKLKNDVKKMTVYATAMGLYQLYVNSCEVGDGILSPGYTSYDFRLQIQTYEIPKELIDLKDNSVKFEFLCGKGWASGTFGYDNEENNYADHISINFEIKIEYEDGTQEIFVSDSSVEVLQSQYWHADIYNGICIDHSFNTTKIGHAISDSLDVNMVMQKSECVIEMEKIYPRSIIKTPDGKLVIDFGQNFSGYVEVHGSGPKGSKLIIKHGEVLDKEQNMYTKNLRQAKQETIYIFSGENEEMFKPKFTFQGFRYIQLVEYPENFEFATAFVAVAIHTKMKRTSHFMTGNMKINQLYSNVIWGQKSNFVDIPTDCPQRDERLGWTGDAQVFIKTAAINYDVEAFFVKWLEDCALEQLDNGEVNCFVPDFKPAERQRCSAGWGDAIVICPWEIYLAYGNVEVLETFIEPMMKWIDYIGQVTKTKDLWIGGNHFGDWLAMDSGEGTYEGATDKDFIASAFYAYSTSIVAKALKVLERDSRQFDELAVRIKEAFHKQYVVDELPIYETQTACALMLKFGLAKNPKKVAEKLCHLIKRNNGRLNTGFIGTPYLLHALSENGCEVTASDLVFQEEAPSWLYSVNKGATTIWEHWDGIKEDGSFWSDDMNSYNHYAYGSVFSWMFMNYGGIQLDETCPGYEKAIIKPYVDERLGFVDASIDTKYGNYRCYWTITDDYVRYEVTVPKNGRCEFVLTTRTYELKAGDYIFYSNLNV